MGLGLEFWGLLWVVSRYPEAIKDVSSLDGPKRLDLVRTLRSRGEAEETCLEDIWKERHWVEDGEELSTAPPLGFRNGNGGASLRICVVLALLRNLVG